VETHCIEQCDLAVAKQGQPGTLFCIRSLLPECTVSTEAIESSSNGGSMARKRYQKGFVYLNQFSGVISPLWTTAFHGAPEYSNNRALNQCTHSGE